ncbi:MAG: S24 family peptidase [Planctomycetota bacterium]
MTARQARQDDEIATRIDRQPPAFGTIVRDRRLRMGLSLRETAERARCTKGYLSLLERGMRGAPGPKLMARLEAALELAAGTLSAVAAMEATPIELREELAERRRQAEAARQLASLLQSAGPGGLDDAYQSGALQRLVERLGPAGGGAAADAEGGAPVRALLPGVVPLINLVPAGEASEFTDLGYPARVADAYVQSPDLADPDAFAARITGDSMEPQYVEGDVVIFSPARDVKDGMDCFARLEPDHETTFKRVYFERGGGGEELIRLQPLNSRYAPRVEPRERVAGLYPAVSLTRGIG